VRPRPLGGGRYPGHWIPACRKNTREREYAGKAAGLGLTKAEDEISPEYHGVIRPGASALSATLKSQLRDNAIAIISLILGIASFSYTSLRMERSEHNLTTRDAAFQMLVALGAMKQPELMPPHATILIPLSRRRRCLARGEWCRAMTRSRRWRLASSARR
jgi:hypothetical protein